MDIRSSRVLPWLLRVAWASQAVVAGPAFAAALDPRSRPVQLVATLGLWGGWAIVLLATAVPAPVSLTVLRCSAPAAVAAALWAAVSNGPSPTEAAAAVLITAATAGIAFSAGVGYAFVNGPAYGDERRFPLRPPAPVLLVLAPLVWAAAAGAGTAAALLLATRAWIAGALVAAAAVPAVFVAARSLHSLSLRWAVLVPAGLVLKDPLALLDPVLFMRPLIEVLRPAPAGTDSLDLTGRAPGLALEIVLTEKVEMTLVRQGHRLGETGRSARLLFTPTRPGRLLEDAGAARIPVG